MAKQINTTIEIESTADNVWRILTDFQNYPKWNPFIKAISGKLSIGQQLCVTMSPQNSSPMTFKPTVIDYEKNKLIKWSGKLWVRGLFDGVHSFEIIDNHNGTITFHQNEIFSGVLVPLLNLDNTKKGFEAMNVALKHQCES